MLKLRSTVFICAAFTAQIAAAESGTVSMGGADVVQMGDSNSAAGRGPSSGATRSGNYGGPASSSDDEWKFEYHGYFRAPLRFGVGERLNAKSDQSKTTISQPLVPDDQYLNWQYTKANQRAWAEAFFSYGKKSARGTLGLQAFNFTDAASKDNTAQFGIAQGWVEWEPDLSEVDEDMRMLVKVGSFWARYGGAGRYDAGAYDSFIFGRTHVMGALVRGEYDVDDATYHVELGGGAKEPNPEPFHNTKFTLLAHGHVGASFSEEFDIRGHVMHAWTQEPDHDCVSREEEWAVQNTAALSDETVKELAARYSEAPVGACRWEGVTGDSGTQTPNDEYVRGDSPDGSMTTLGAEIVWNAPFARWWAGGSYLIADHAVTLDAAYELLHANGGGFFNMGVTHQYFVERQNWENAQMNVQSNGGNGNIATFATQVDTSLSSLFGADVMGGQDVKLQGFLMFNQVHSDDDPGLKNYSKLKYGADIEYSPLPWMGAALRIDSLSPRSDIKEQSFWVLGPRLTFRSDYGTHEEINIGWAHYMYDTISCASYNPNGPDSLYCVQPPTAVVGPAGWYQRPGVNASKALRGTPTEPGSRTGKYPNIAWDDPHTNTFYINASIWW